MRMLGLTLLTFKKVKLIFGHPVVKTIFVFGNRQNKTKRTKFVSRL